MRREEGVTLVPALLPWPRSQLQSTMWLRVSVANLLTCSTMYSMSSLFWQGTSLVCSSRSSWVSSTGPV